MIDIERLNYLAKKSKIEGLTDEEKAEQAAMRRVYRQRKGVVESATRQHLYR